MKNQIKAALSALDQIPASEWAAELRKLKGEFDDGQIAGLIRLADFAVEKLAEISEAKPELIKPHARRRINWPAKISLTDSQEQRYQKLRGAIELGAGLPYRLDRKTKAGTLHNMAVRAITNLIDRREANRDWFGAMFEGDEFFEAWRRGRAAHPIDWLATFGPFTEANFFKHWQHALGVYFTFSYQDELQKKPA